MGITMSPQEYATAFRLLAASARHPRNIHTIVTERLFPGLPEHPTLLDVGAGAGKVAEQLAPHFDSLTLLEPHPEQSAGFHHEKAKVIPVPLERYDSQDRYDLVVCSHVLYHVPLSEWGGFIDRLLRFVRPGGTCLLVMAAARGPTHAMCREFSDTLHFSEDIVAEVRRKQLPHETIATMSGFAASTFEEMYTLCRFLVLEGCFTSEQLAALNPDEWRRLDARIRGHAERCQQPDGTYRLEQDEDVILIPR
ncbi:class I SAM-dependent methyltransferase [Corallococcus carmarthensis]|uniref:Class I SAM-dependent methyltransferase n=2 Tax=Corallococcus carmarthensis TaxID=2316728 RepID=A0A3A8KH19_9BACT|nr:class I SAM-dependent methyltransferase [Corallococcus carmarthensis]NOK15878.1 class I SAM-dependent methyltransferase [Corallococcus carmarthensis]RKH07498.1 class I SAM-dependent methyltransferase [Corallococcus carmarthensis]